MRYLLVVNPGSRGGRSGPRHGYWISEMEARGVDFHLAETRAPGHARELAQEAGGYDGVVAVGGDGTINEVLDGLLLSGRRDVAMGVLYAGTSPDFCRFHGISTDPPTALQRLLESRPRAVDAVRIRYRDADRTIVNGHFGCSANVGLGAAVASVANRLRPTLGDTLGTGVAVLRAFFTTRPMTLRITTEDDTLELSRVNHLVVLKNPFIASGLKLGVELTPDDGRLCLVAVTGRSPFGMLGLLPGFYSGNAIRAPGVVVRYCTRVSLEAQGPASLEFDGDPQGWLPAEMAILPAALRLLGR